MKKLSILMVLITSSLCAKLNWQSPETWKSYYPYVTFVNQTNYDLELAIVSSNSETEWQPIAKNETLPLVFTPGFKELRAKLPTMNTVQQIIAYNFTKELKPDIEKVLETLERNPYAAIKITVVIKENKNPFKQNAVLIHKYGLPDLTIVVHTEFVNTKKATMYTVAKTINSSTR